MTTRPLSLLLDPCPVARPWGGSRTARRFGWSAPAGETIGEWWLASTRDDASTRLRGTDDGLGAWLRGPGRALGYDHGTFPLLVKLLDCEQVLSVQVHPSDAVARRQGLPRGKTEAWHVIDADPGAGVYLGTADGVTARELLDAVERGADAATVTAMLRRVPATPGDTLLVEAGTIHAIDGGVLLYELQQNSDTTWRIFDWGRGRPVHLAQARAAAVDHPPPRVTRRPPRGDEWAPLVRGVAFSLWRARPREEIELEPAARFAVLTVLAGEGEITSGATATPLAPGDTALVLGPALIAGDGLELLSAEPPA